MSELNAIRSGEIYNIIEYEDCYRTDDLYYPKSEADKVIESITEDAISMFRDSNKYRGLDLKSPLGRIANAAFKHWSFVEFIQNKNTQLQEDKERLLQNNHHLLDEAERLKEDVADARQKACGYQETILVLEKSYKKLVKKFVHESSVAESYRSLIYKDDALKYKEEGNLDMYDELSKKSDKAYRHANRLRRIFRKLSQEAK